MSAAEPRIAGLLTVRNYDDGCAAFESLRALCDFVIVLDDCSDRPFPHRDRCDEYLALSRSGPWNDLANRTTLLYRAFVHDCRWAVSIDDDVLYGAGFQTRSDVVRLIEVMERGRKDVGLFRLRDLWGSVERYRADGLWGEKSFAVLRRNWFFDRRITLHPPATNRLHRPIAPKRGWLGEWLQRRRRLVFGGLTAYHTGCLTPERRAARVEKYRREDPDNAYQRDYGYMLATDGIRLEPVSAADLRIIRAKYRA